MSEDDRHSVRKGHISTGGNGRYQQSSLAERLAQVSDKPYIGKSHPILEGVLRFLPEHLRDEHCHLFMWEYNLDKCAFKKCYRSQGSLLPDEKTTKLLRTPEVSARLGRFLAEYLTNPKIQTAIEQVVCEVYGKYRFKKSDTKKGRHLGSRDIKEMDDYLVLVDFTDEIEAVRQKNKTTYSFPMGVHVWVENGTDRPAKRPFLVRAYNLQVVKHYPKE